MKKFTLLLLTCLLISTSFLQAQQGRDIPIWKKMHYLSEEEMKLPHDNLKSFYPTDPPEHPVRMLGEYEQMQSVLVRYPFGIPTALIVEMSQDCGVTTLVNNQSQQNTVTNIYQTNGANMDNIDFIQAPTDSYWTRDYGPWFVIDGNGEFGVCNFQLRVDTEGIPKIFEINARHSGTTYIRSLYGFNEIEYILEYILNKKDITFTIKEGIVKRYFEEFLVEDNYCWSCPDTGEYFTAQEINDKCIAIMSSR